MNKKILDLIIFTASTFILLISLKLFWNMGIFADEFNTSPAVVCGGSFWLAADWLRLGLSAAATIASGIRLFNKNV